MSVDEYVKELRERIEFRLMGQEGTRTRKGILEFNCPAHADTGSNAYLQDYAWGCWVCGESIGTGKLVDLAQHLGVDTGSSSAPSGYTLESYADEKGFSAAKLREWGVEDITTEKGWPAVGFRCRSPDGQLIRTQARVRGGKQFWHNDGRGVYLYGLDFLAKITDERPVLLVEGVSDVHALWHMGIAAAGCPGANAWKADWAQHFADIPRLYVWQEPGQGGEAFVAAVAKALPTVRILSGTKIGGKDPADLRKALGDEEAKQQILRAMRKALPVGVRELEIEYDELGEDELTRLGERLAGPIEVVPTPFPLWNGACRMFGGGQGLARGWYILIGGTAGFGKTYTATAIGTQAVIHGEGVAFHSLEMGWDELTLRALAQLTNTEIRHIEPGSYHRADVYRQAVEKAMDIQERSGGRFYIPRRPLKSLPQVLDSMRYHWEVNGCKLHIIDYLQLAWVGKANSMTEQIIEVSHQVRELTKELRVVTVGLSQFKREASQDRERRPQKEDLLGGSALENDSDQTLVLDHSRIIRNPQGFSTWGILDKNRHGPLVDIPLHFATDTLTMRQRQDDEILASETEPSLLDKKKGRRG